MNTRITSLLVSSSMILSLLPISAQAQTQAFYDMPQDYSTDALNNAVKHGLLEGHDNLLNPTGSLTRAELATILVRAFGAETASSLGIYQDVSSGQWFYAPLSKALAMGIMEGSGDTMRPTDSVTRQEVAVVLASAFGLSSSDFSHLNSYKDIASVATWAKSSVSALVESGYMMGDGTYLHPETAISRKDFAVILDAMVKHYVTASGSVTAFHDGSVMVNTADVTFENMTIQGDLIIGDGVGDGDITLDNVTITGQLLVRGGGVNSILIKGNSKVPEINVAKVLGNVRVAVDDSASVSRVSVRQGKNPVILEGSVSTLAVNAITPVIVRNGDLEYLSVEVDNASVTLEAKANITNLALDSANSTLVLEGDSFVETLVATSNATGADITAEKDSEITAVFVDAVNTTLFNDGEIGSVGFSNTASSSTYIHGDHASTEPNITAENLDSVEITTQAMEEAKEALNNATSQEEMDAAQAKLDAAQGKVDSLADSVVEGTVSIPSTEDLSSGESYGDSSSGGLSSSGSSSGSSGGSSSGGSTGGGSSDGNTGGDSSNGNTDGDSSDDNTDGDSSDDNTDEDSNDKVGADENGNGGIYADGSGDMVLNRYPHQILAVTHDLNDTLWTDFEGVDNKGYSYTFGYTKDAGWKVQLPIWKDSNQQSILEKTGQELIDENYVAEDVLYVAEAFGEEWVVLNCGVDGAKTSNTAYSRTEFREMLDMDNASANWGYEGTHIQETRQMVTKVPSSGLTVTSQIHGVYADGENGPVLVKVEYDYNYKAVVVLLKSACGMTAADNKHYFYGVDLNQIFDTRIEVTGGAIYVTIESEGREETFWQNFANDDPTWYDVRGYFKAGNYVQDSSYDYEGEGATVWMSRMDIYHSDESENILPTKIEFPNQEISLGVGESTALSVDFTPLKTLNKAVTWEIVSGGEYGALTKSGTVVGIADGNVVIKATSVANPSLTATCTVKVGAKQSVEVKEITPTISNSSTSNTTASTTKTTEAGVDVYTVKDTASNGTGSTKISFPNQAHTTTISYDIRVNANNLKSEQKPQTSCIYMYFGGTDSSSLNSSTRAFCIRNNADNTSAEIYNNRWGFSHSYLDVTRNTAAAGFTVGSGMDSTDGDWKNVTVVITPNDCTAAANTTTVYYDGYRVTELTSNNVSVDYINMVQIATGTDDTIGYSVKNVQVWSGDNAPSVGDATEKITLGTLPSTMAVGNYVQVQYEVPDGQSEEVTYSVSDTSVLAVSESGLLVATGKGTAKVIVTSKTDSSVKAEWTIKVEESITGVEKITLKENNLKMVPVDVAEDGTVTEPEGSTYDLSKAFTFTPASPTETAVLYTVTSGTNVVSVTPMGLVTATGVGTATIRITSLDNPSAYATVNISVFNTYEPGDMIFEDGFDKGTLDADYWTTATSNVGDTVNQILNISEDSTADYIMFMEDSNNGGQPKSYVAFEPQAETFTVQYDFVVLRDYHNGASSGSYMALGNNTITSSSNEAFRMGSYSSNKGQEHFFRYHDETGSYKTIENTAFDLDLYQWVTIALTSTKSGSSDTFEKTTIYLDGEKVAETENKTALEYIDQFILQSGTADLGAFAMDNFKVWSGTYDDGKAYHDTDKKEQTYAFGDYPPAPEALVPSKDGSISVSTNVFNWNNKGGTVSTVTKNGDSVIEVKGTETVKWNYMLADADGKNILAEKVVVSMKVMTENHGNNNLDSGIRFSLGGDNSADTLSYFRFSSSKLNSDSNSVTTSSQMVNDTWIPLTLTYTLNGDKQVQVDVEYGDVSKTDLVSTATGASCPDGLIEVDRLVLASKLVSGSEASVYYKDIKVEYSTSADWDKEPEVEEEEDTTPEVMTTFTLPTDLTESKWSNGDKISVDADGVFTIPTNDTGKEINTSYKVTGSDSDVISTDKLVLTYDVKTGDLDGVLSGIRLATAGNNSSSAISYLRYKEGSFEYQGINSTGTGSSYKSLLTPTKTDWVAVEITYTVNSQSQLVATISYDGVVIATDLVSGSTKALAMITNNENKILFNRFCFLSESSNTGAAIQYKNIVISYSGEIISTTSTTSNTTSTPLVPPEEVTPEEAIPEEATPEEVTPEEVTPEEVTPEEVTPEEVTPEETTPVEVTPEEGAPEEENLEELYESLAEDYDQILNEQEVETIVWVD